MWKAIFKDGSELTEFDQFGKEVLFRNVMDRVGDLKTLSIVLSSVKTYTIDFTNFEFTIMNDKTPTSFYGLDIEKYSPTTLTNIRPIYFVRETIDMSTTGIPGVYKGSTPRVELIALGFQANVKGNNIKKYLMIFPDGKYIVRDE